MSKNRCLKKIRKTKNEEKKRKMVKQKKKKIRNEKIN